MDPPAWSWDDELEDRRSQEFNPDPIMSETKPKVVFFDAGGTLLQERVSRGEIYRQAFAECGIEVSLTRMEEAMRSSFARLPRRIGPSFRFSDGWFRVFIQSVSNELGAPGVTQSLEASLFDRFSASQTFHLFEDVLPTLQSSLDRGLRLGVISNWGSRLRRILTGLGIAEMFEAVFISAEQSLEKPDRRLFERACASMGVQPDQAAHVGDHPQFDGVGASNAGLKAYLIDRDPSSTGEGSTREESAPESPARESSVQGPRPGPKFTTFQKLSVANFYAVQS